jgi:preprotein translocase SecF subunit
MRLRQLDFLGKAKFLVPLSVCLVVASAVLLIPSVRGLKMGIDFTGGTELTVKFAERVDSAAIRKVLGTVNAGSLDLQTSKIQSAGPNTYTITTQLLNVETDVAIINNVDAALKSAFPGADINRSLIGQQISKELAQSGLLAILIAMGAMLIYISWRFRFRYAIAAILELVHDVTIALGIFAVLGLEFNLETIAAFLTLVGYSLNDTIVVFDRIRENLKLDQKRSLFDTINLSINQSLTRTINTSATTLLPVVVLLLLGGTVLRGFSVAMLVGIIAGTYSSWYIGTPILYWWARKFDKGRAGEKS